MTTTYAWRRDGVTDAEVRQELATCEYHAELQCGTQYSLSETEAANRKARFKLLSRTCMMSKGFQAYEVTGG